MAVLTAYALSQWLVIKFCEVPNADQCRYHASDRSLFESKPSVSTSMMASVLELYVKTGLIHSFFSNFHSV